MGVSDFFDELDKDRKEAIKGLSDAELEIRLVIEDWFGECIEYLENTAEVEKHLLKPLYKVVRKWQNVPGVVSTANVKNSRGK